MDFKNGNIWLMKGDCLERMKEIHDGSVSMILCLGVFKYRVANEQ